MSQLALLRSRRFAGLFWAQFLGAFNDNLFKFVVTLVAAGAAVGADANRAVSLAGMVFVAPFLLFSGYAGQLADTYSKRTVLVVTKSLEIAGDLCIYTNRNFTLEVLA